MFGLFKNKKTNKKKSGEEKLSPSEVLRAINQIQRELDLLKLAISEGSIANAPKEEGRLVDQALATLKSEGALIQKSASEKVIEGVFDGQSMVGADGEQYDVPANYASKSKLVEGDILKLSINNMGAFIYKQIKPIERLRKVGELGQDPQSMQYYVTAEGKKWKLLTASVTYYKGEDGDEVVFLIPAEAGSRWAAVENIIKK